MLLNNEDVQPDGNYSQLQEGIPYYALKNTGATARGIRLGDTYEDVIEKYGTPHSVSHKETTILEYYTPYFPNSSSGSTLIFQTENNVVTTVELDY